MPMILLNIPLLQHHTRVRSSILITILSTHSVGRLSCNNIVSWMIRNVFSCSWWVFVMSWGSYACAVKEFWNFYVVFKMCNKRANKKPVDTRGVEDVPSSLNSMGDLAMFKCPPGGLNRSPPSNGWVHEVHKGLLTLCVVRNASRMSSGWPLTNLSRLLDSGKWAFSTAPAQSLH